MDQEQVRLSLVILLDALENSVRSNALITEALVESVPGFQEVLAKVAEKERQMRDKNRRYNESKSLGQLNIEVIDVLSRMIAKESL